MNAALSGALASNIPHEVNDYLIPQVKARNIPASAYKYMSLQIGSNDICQFCIQAEVGFGPESADDFEVNIRKALEAVRKGIRKF
jgi:phospholipase B1